MSYDMLCIENALLSIVFRAFYIKTVQPFSQKKCGVES